VIRKVHLGVALVAIASVTVMVSTPVSGQAAASSSLEARLQRQEDTEAIRRLLREYGKRLDAMDLQGYANLFAVDGEWVGGFGSVKGRAQIAPFMEKNMRNPLPSEGTASAVARPGPRGVHVLTNEIIDLAGDRATVWSKWTYMGRNADNRPVPIMVGTYDDVVVREKGEWKFLKRVVWGDVPYAPPPGVEKTPQ
jgi:uncharacterized protein (TIGR02246 family)